MIAPEPVFLPRIRADGFRRRLSFRPAYTAREGLFTAERKAERLMQGGNTVMKFEIADWRFEVTWSGLLLQPLERGRAKAAKKNAAQSVRRDGEVNRHALGLAAHTFNERRPQKGATK